MADRFYGSSPIAAGTLIGCDPKSLASVMARPPEVAIRLEGVVYFDSAGGPISTPERRMSSRRR